MTESTDQDGIVLYQSPCEINPKLEQSDGFSGDECKRGFDGAELTSSALESSGHSRTYAQYGFASTRILFIFPALLSALGLLIGDLIHCIISYMFCSGAMVIEQQKLIIPPVVVQLWGDIDDLDAQVDECRKVMAAARIDKIDSFVPYVAVIANALTVRYRREGQLDDLDTQIALCEEALELAGRLHPGRGLLLCELAEPLRLRARPRGVPSDFNRSIELCREALTLCSLGFLQRQRPLDLLGAGLRSLYLQSGNKADLVDSIQMHEEALELCPPGHAFRHRSLSNLASALEVMYHESGSMDDLDLALRYHREGLVLRVKGHPERIISLTCMAVLLGARFDARSDIENLNEGVQLLEEAVDEVPVGHQEREYAVGNLAGMLLYRYDTWGDSKDLDKAINLLVETLDLRPPGHLLRPLTLGNLADALRSRFAHTENIEDIDFSIRLLREALDDSEEDSPSRPKLVADLSMKLLERCERTDCEGDEGDLTEALSLAEKSLELRPEGNPHRGEALQTLGRCLQLRFELHSDVKDLDRAILVDEECIVIANATNCWDRFKYLLQLSRSYRMRYIRVTKSEEDLITVRRLLMETMHIVGIEHAGRSECLFEFARLHFLENTSFHDVTAALRFLRDAVLDTHRSAQVRLMDGLNIVESRGTCTWDDDTRELLLEVHAAMVRLLPRVAYFGLNIRSRLRVLKKAATLANNATSHALMLSRPGIAIEMSEEGRGIFWTQALHLRTPFNNLPPLLTQKLVSLSRQLEENSHSDPVAPQVAHDAADQRHLLSTEFERVLAQARAIPGFEHFLLPDSYKTLRAAAKEGPIVVLIASHIVCQAIFVEDSSQEARQMPRDGEAGVRGLRIVRPDSGSYGLLAELWHTVAVPVIAALGCYEPDCSRVSASSTATLSERPIHVFTCSRVSASYSKP